VIVKQTREVEGQPWYLIEVQRHGSAVCTAANRAATGTEGWASGLLLADVETTALIEVLPTFTPAPAPTRARPTPALAPSANCHPSYPGVYPASAARSGLSQHLVSEVHRGRE
jgi:hypothetical protein